ncbi:MAG: carbamoyltransferase HypF [Leptolinea sp.]
MSKQKISGLAIQVRGIVQGVGFRPFIYQLAAKNNLTGWVRNTSNGVEIEIEGKTQSLQAFLNQITSSPPLLARIDLISHQACRESGYTQFAIIESLSDPSQFIPVSPDISTCPDCLREINDPDNRRYHYPFTNCTNCGPRFTIIKDIPYDRPFTTMADFSMCMDCLKEYEDPMDRRFHAQPIACPVCGPELEFSLGTARITGNDKSISAAQAAIQQGKILAIKGLGGFHLACDASNSTSIDELRNRKNRIEKPFALMALSVDIIEKYCLVSKQEKELLESRQRPIVLLKKKTDCLLPSNLAPGQTSLGFMLPYTPMHYLLLEKAADFPEALVMTSGNLSEEPIAFEDQDAKQRLSSLADGFLTHNRDIHIRVDDSVMRIIEHTAIFNRRSRGYAPDPISLPFNVKPILAAGAQLKNHFTLTRDAYAFHSHYIGDLENYETLQSFEQGIAHFEKLFRIKPNIIACDLHPDYLSTRYSQNRSQRENIPLVQVQHHHAHQAACMIENGWDSEESVIGLTFDGAGYGTDGTIWGGEILVGNYKEFQRRFHIDPFLLPGGDKSVHVPARTALSLLTQYNLDWELSLPPVSHFSSDERNVIQSQLKHHINSPLTSSMGRLFDAISALLGIRQQVTYEGQAAIELEAACDPSETGLYNFQITGSILDPKPVFFAILQDFLNKIPIEKIAARFHNGIIQTCLETCKIIRNETGISTVSISGGVWQNVILFSKTVRLLESNNFKILSHKKLPTNDACISMGQAVIAARMIQ